MSKEQWTDVHTHLNMLKIPPEKAISSAKAQGIINFITIGTEPSDWPAVLDLILKHESVYGALGMHPHSARLYNEEADLFLNKNLSGKKIKALGEIGLDYYYEHSEKQVQMEVFLKQMEIAAQKKLPVEIHSREAEKDTMTVLEKFKGRVKGLLHCFTSSWELARYALDRGFDISFSGILTFKKASALREVCQKTPLDRLHLETDAPYLAPEPLRGKENEPAFLIHTAGVMANLHNISLEKLSITVQNNKNILFGF